MTLSVASRLIHRPARISEHARLVLNLIERGRQWLEWAIHDPRARYHFENEEALVAGVQAGLHASPLLLLRNPALMVGPAKLMTLDLADLRFLVRARDGDGGKPAAIRIGKICAAYGLVTQAELAAAADFLEDLGVADEPVFQAMTFEERLAIHHLSCHRDELPGPAFQEEAAAFAVGQARTPLEFIDYYKAYLQYLAAARKLPRDPGQRTARVKAAVDTLLPHLYHALDCPRVDAPAAPWEVAAAIDEWLMMGRRLGFSRLSQGAQQVIAHTPFARRDRDADADAEEDDEEEEEVRAIVAAYLAGAHALLGSAEVAGGRIGQDGASRTLEVRSGRAAADIALGFDGIITLSGFHGSPTGPAMPITQRRKSWSS